MDNVSKAIQSYHLQKWPHALLSSSLPHCGPLSCSLFQGRAPHPNLRQRPGSHPRYLLLRPLQSLPETTHWQFLTILPFNIFAFLFVPMFIITLSCIQFLPATGPLHSWSLSLDQFSSSYTSFAWLTLAQSIQGSLSCLDRYLQELLSKHFSFQ